MNNKIADLHCDLLCYLAGGAERTPYDNACRCSIPQMKAGHVALQVLPVFTTTEPGSVESGLAQVSWFMRLLNEFSDDTVALDSFGVTENKRIAIALSVENASSFFAEDESLHVGFNRLSKVEEATGKIVYISMTWNGQNRFGGGAHSDQGITADGIALLHFLNGKKTAIDLSHASDALAYDILNQVDKCSFDIPIIASHSNCRAVTGAVRNLPDELITEIIQRDGLIGFNFVRSFVGPESPEGFIRHLEHFFSLGAEKHLCFGADFYYGNDVPPEYRKPSDELFFPGYDNSGAYQDLIALWKEWLGVERESVERIAWKTLNNFLESKIYKITKETSASS